MTDVDSVFKTKTVVPPSILALLQALYRGISQKLSLGRSTFSAGIHSLTAARGVVE